MEVRREGDGHWLEGRLQGPLCEGDTVRVGRHSRAAIQLINSAVLRLDQNTTIQLRNIVDQRDESSLLYLREGLIQSFSRQPSRLRFQTPHLKAWIKGTEFLLGATAEQSTLAVAEGHVEVTGPGARVAVNGGESVTVRDGVAMTVVKWPEAARTVQWALFYPPILAVFDGGSSDVAENKSPAVRAARELADQGQIAAALRELEVAAGATDARLAKLYRAALLTGVGRVDEATDLLGEVSADDELGGLAFAQQAVIAVVQHKLPEAMRDAMRATQLSQAAAPAIALSYVYQAQLQLAAATATLRTASVNHPTNPLIWARLAEVELMAGERASAWKAASRALQIAPLSSRAQAVFGFCALARFQVGEARDAFEAAIRLRSSDPMAHLGLGLAKIRAGDLAGGRRDIETAVALDSNNALLRSYLGKAYFEEQRSDLAAQQYALAKSLDRQDPTAFLYNGLLLQSQNRPAEALQEVEVSRRLNNNRAVYRSPAMLERDATTRGISQARTYRDSGFNLLSVNTATESVGHDPASATAHRFLADAYLGVRRREIARVSELLQAQLLQDINLTPIQPSVIETNLNTVTIGGVSPPGFNEFDALFHRDGMRFDGSAFGGSFGTYGGEGLVSAMGDRYALSAGSFYYGTDGWRANNALEQNIVNVYAQAALSPELHAQAEFRHRQSREGDLAFNFDPAMFSRDRRVDREQDITRLGLRYTPSASSNLLFSYIHADRKEHLQVGGANPIPGFAGLDDLAQSVGDQFEWQWLYSRDSLHLITGAAYSEAQRTDSNFGALNGFMGAAGSMSRNVSHAKGYVYSLWDLPASLALTVGVSFDHYDESLIRRSEVNPKAGLRWSPNDRLQVRTAIARTLKPLLVNNRTLEPTQVAGLNQLFDDIDGTVSERFGGGFDWRVTSDLFVGGEVTWREFNEPVLTSTNGSVAVAVGEDRKEQLHSLYLYWLASTQFSIRTELVYDRFHAARGFGSLSGVVPQRVETLALPITLRYFDPSGVSASLGATFVTQTLACASPLSLRSGSSTFTLVDATVAYRLPNRWGQLAIGVTNLLDTRFRYQDDSFREFRDESAIGPYFPERMFIGRISLSLE